MNEQEITAATVTVAAEVAKEIAAEVYTDAAKPATHEAGEALGAIVGLFNNVVLHPIKLANLHFRYKLEQFERDLKQNLENVPEEKIQHPPIAIAGPALEALRYNIDTEELRSMYLKLLSSAMNTDTADSTHPSFVEVIKGMSARDAEIYRLICFKPEIPIAKIQIGYDDKTFAAAMPDLFAPVLKSQHNPFQVSESIFNLTRLGLINIHILGYPKVDYEAYKSHEFVISRAEWAQSHLPEGKTLKIRVDPSAILKNDFGKTFAKTCIY